MRKLITQTIDMHLVKLIIFNTLIVIILTHRNIAF
jgi:hypothetical protein